MKIQNLLEAGMTVEERGMIDKMAKHLISAGFKKEMDRGGDQYSIIDETTDGGFNISIRIGGDKARLQTLNTFSDRTIEEYVNPYDEQEVSKFLKKIKTKLKQVHKKLIDNNVKQADKKRKFKKTIQTFIDLGFDTGYDFFGKHKKMLKNHDTDMFFPMKMTYRGKDITRKLRGTFTIRMFSSFGNEGYVFHKAEDVKAVIDLFVDRDM